MRLGDLIDTLAAMPATYEVKFDTGDLPGHFHSWRGIYDELTLEPVPDEGGRVLVRSLLENARRADGGVFTGYKGGEYRMDRSTPVWADRYGEYDCNGLMGVVVVDGVVILQTADLSDYR